METIKKENKVISSCSVEDTEVHEDIINRLTMFIHLVLSPISYFTERLVQESEH